MIWAIFWDAVILGSDLFCDCTSELYLMTASQSTKISNFEITHAQSSSNLLKSGTTWYYRLSGPERRLVLPNAAMKSSLLPDPVSIRYAEKAASFMESVPIIRQSLFNKVINSKNQR